ncbi:cupin domain-containing protein [Streptomyces sp. MAI_2237]
MATFGPLTLGRLAFGAEVRIQFGELGSYHVDIPLGGHLAWRQGRHTAAVATTGNAAVFQPHGDTALALNQQLERLLGRPLRAPVTLLPELDIAHGAGLSWVRMVRAVFDEMRVAGLLTRPMVARPRRRPCWPGSSLPPATATATNSTTPIPPCARAPSNALSKPYTPCRNTPSRWRNWPCWRA